MTRSEWIEARGWEGEAEQIRSRFGLHPVTCMLLTGRTRSVADLEGFLRPGLLPWPDPERLPNMKDAAARIGAAVRHKESVLVHGDYDVDGLMGAATLVGGLRALGARVDAFIPSRFDGGYGLSETSVEAVKRAGATLVVTTDCGTNAKAIGERLASLGVDLIVSDHHIPAPDLLAPGLIVNPHLQEGHPDQGMCGAAVALQLLRGTASAMGRKLPLEPFLRLVAIATIADVVPMTAVNRKICKEGLKAIETTPNPGLALLVNGVCGGGAIRGHHVSFHMAPRFNAAGRMEDARLVLDLLLERNAAKAATLMGRLESLNRKRKALQAAAFEEALQQVQGGDGDRVVFAASPAWHKGIIGPVAARLADAMRKSAFVVAVEGDEAVGSARSFRDDDVSALLAQAADLLIRFGGHSGAAGFSLKTDLLPDLGRRLVELPADENGSDPAERYFPLECGDLPKAWDAWGLIDPFGPGNPEPLLGISGVRCKGQRVASDRHLIWDSALPDGGVLQLIAWDGLGEGLTPSSLMPSRTIVGRLAPQARTGTLPYYFSVHAIL